MGSGNSKRTCAMDHIVLEGSSRTKKPASAAPRCVGRGGAAGGHGARTGLPPLQERWLITVTALGHVCLVNLGVGRKAWNVTYFSKEVLDMSNPKMGFQKKDQKCGKRTIKLFPTGLSLRKNQSLVINVLIVTLIQDQRIMDPYELKE